MNLAVIIPCYNSAEWIAETVESVLDQTVPPAEVIVVNDGSTDDSRAVLRTFEPRLRVIDQANAGLSHARNAGARASRAEWLTFLDADDLYEVEFVAGVREFIAAFPASDLLFTDCIQFCADRVLLPSMVGHFVPTARSLSEEARGELLLFGPRFLDVLIERNGAFPPSTMVVRRSLFDRLNGFCEQLRGAQDLDFYLHAGPKTQVGLVLRPLVRKREHPASMNRQYQTMRPDLEILWERARSLCRSDHPELLPAARQKYVGQLGSWSRGEYKLGMYAEARHSFSRLVRAEPLSWRNWFGLAAATIRCWCASPRPQTANAEGVG